MGVGGCHYGCKGKTCSSSGGEICLCHVVTAALKPQKRPVILSLVRDLDCIKSAIMAFCNIQGQY